MVPHEPRDTLARSRGGTRAGRGWRPRGAPRRRRDGGTGRRRRSPASRRRAAARRPRHQACRRSASPSPVAPAAAPSTPALPAAAAAAASTVRTVWSHRSSPAIFACGTPRCAASSGSATSSSPVSASRRSPTEGTGARRSRSILRADPRPGEVGEVRPCRSIAARVPASTVNPSVDASRSARSIRRASSANLASGSPTARIVRAARSARPSWGSTRHRAAPAGPGRAPECHRVHREVAPGEVLVERRAEGDVRRPAVVVVAALGPVRRDLVLPAAPRHRHRAVPVLVARPGEEGDAAARVGVRREVPVERVTSEQHVPHRAAHDERVAAGLRSEASRETTSDGRRASSGSGCPMAGTGGPPDAGPRGFASVMAAGGAGRPAQDRPRKR